MIGHPMRTSASFLLVVTLAGCQTHKPKALSASESYIRKQEKIIDSHAVILQKQGRMPVDFAEPYMVLGQYGWHTERGLTSVGGTPETWLLRQGGGSFGAYSFYQPAFEQAKRSWWIHGVMKTGSDLLIAVNRNANFDNSDCLEMKRVNGAGEDCPAINNPVGFQVGYMYAGPKNAHVIAVVDSHTLRLDKPSPGDVMPQYDLGILPPDYQDMCACTMSALATVDGQKP